MPMTRRAALAGVPAMLLAGRAPGFFRRDAARPGTPGGVASGDPLPGRAVVWSVTDRPARLVVEWSRRESLADAVRVAGPLATPETGFTARVELAGLPDGVPVFYRATFEDADDSKVVSVPVTGRLVTPPRDAKAGVRFCWGGDTAGQGWGICAADGGMRIYKSMREWNPDFFIHSGDTIYADNPIAELPDTADGKPIRLQNGEVWRNLVTDAKRKVAETLDEFRGNHAYNLLDANVRAFNAHVPQIVQWDDHETTNNWFPGRVLDDPRYAQERDCRVLAERAGRAFREYQPLRLDGPNGSRIYRAFEYGPLLDVIALDLRTYRGPNTGNRQESPGPETAFLGREQIDWLKRTLRHGKGRWKVIASDMPIGLVIPDKYRGKDLQEAVANGPGPALGRELEFAEILKFIKDENIPNVVWVTADVHYAAAHRYEPGRATFRDFAPFWEFVAGPLHAGTFGPNALDPTFGPSVEFCSVPPGMKPNRPPSEGLQFFGGVSIAPTGVMTVTLHDIAGRVLYTKVLEPA